MSAPKTNSQGFRKNRERQGPALEMRVKSLGVALQPPNILAREAKGREHALNTKSRG